MSGDLISILAIGAMLIGVLFSALFPKGDRRHERALYIFVLGAATLVAWWLLKNPSELTRIENQLVLALLGIVFVFIQVIKRRVGA